MTLPINQILQGDTLTILKTLPNDCIDCVITSPPYFGLRDYQVDGQIGLEKTLNEYLDKLLAITAELKRVLKKTGTLWWNHGDSFNNFKQGKTDDINSEEVKRANSKIKKTVQKGIPRGCLLLQSYRLIFKMIEQQGWILRNQIIWWKPNCMPSSTKNRFTVDFEPVFFFAKSQKYYFKTQFEEFQSNDFDRARMAKARTEYGGAWAQASGGAIKMQRAFVAGNKEGRNKRCIWKIETQPHDWKRNFGVKAGHFAVFPDELVVTPILAGCPRGGIVLDPFAGSCTVAVVAKRLKRKYIMIELNKDYIEIGKKRLSAFPEPML